MFTGKLNGISRAEAKSLIEKNSGSIIEIFAGGVEVAGNHFAVFEGSADKRLSIRMKGGVYDHVNPLLFFRLE